jgi:hypothetical protein
MLRVLKLDSNKIKIFEFASQNFLRNTTFNVIGNINFSLILDTLEELDLVFNSNLTTDYLDDLLRQIDFESNYLRILKLNHVENARMSFDFISACLENITILDLSSMQLNFIQFVLKNKIDNRE